MITPVRYKCALIEPSQSKTDSQILSRFIMLFSALTLTLLAATGAARHCTNLTIPLSLSARNGVFNLKAPASNIEVTDFMLDLTRQGHNLTNELLTGVSDSVR
jgi:hypothetical protein